MQKKMVSLWAISLCFLTSFALGAGLVDRYDPARDPQADLASALALAQENRQRVLVEVGGEWCRWCHILDKFLAENDGIAAYLDQKFVLLKVNYSEENENQAFLSQFPKPSGYPHFYIFDSKGRLLKSVNTANLEEGESYSPSLFLAFLKKWAGE